LNSTLDPGLKEKVLAENRRLHALENAEYLVRHPEQTHRYQKRILKAALDEFDRHLAASDASVLEVGCGTGYMYLPLLRRGYRMTGVDVSETLVSVLETLVPQTARPRSHLVVSDVEGFLENNRNRYEGVVCSALLHHLYDYETTVRQLAGRVKPGGVMLIFFEPLKQPIESRWRFFLHRALGCLDEWLYEGVMRRRGIPLIRDDCETADYQRRFGGIDPNHLTALLNECGLGILETHTYCARRFGWAAWLANHILSTQNTFNILAKKF